MYRLLDAGTLQHAVNKYKDNRNHEMENVLRSCVDINGKLDVIMVQEFLMEYPDKVDAYVPLYRRTLLQMAAHEGQHELCICLLDAGASLYAVDCLGTLSWTPLHFAANGNRPEIMFLLLSRGAFIDVVDKYKWSALHIAVNKIHVRCVRLLLHYDCDVNLQNNTGNTALHIAISLNALDIIDILCSCKRINFMLRNNQGFSILHVAASEDNPRVVEKLIEHAHQLVDIENETDGKTALHIAALKGYKKVAEILLSPIGGRAKVDVRDNHQQTPLHKATWWGHWSLVELLIRHNADVCTLDENGNTALHFAIARILDPRTIPTFESRQDSLRINAIWENLILVQDAKAELALACFLVSVDRSCKLLEQVRNNKGKTPLDLLEGSSQANLFINILRSYKYQNNSIRLNCPQTFDDSEHLISEDTDFINHEVKFLMNTPSADMDDVIIESVKKFEKVDTYASNGKTIQENSQVAAQQRELCSAVDRAFLYAVDKHGNTSLHIAADGNQSKKMNILLSQGASINVVNSYKQSALHVAVNKQHVQCVKVLLHYRCDVNLQDSQGNTALHIAISMDALDMINALCSCERIDFMLRNNEGLNILDFAASKSNARVMEKLISHARQLVDVKNEYTGKTALHIVAWRGHRNIAAILLSQNGGRAKVDVRDCHLQTPLHKATFLGHWSLIELLVHHNADVSNTDENGDTPLHFAIARILGSWTRPTFGRRRNSPRIYTIWENLTSVEDGKTELALACFLVSVDRSCKLLEQARNNRGKTPLDLLEGSSQANLFINILRSYKYQNNSTRLETENNPTTSYTEPSTSRIDNVSQKELYEDVKNVIKEEIIEDEISIVNPNDKSKNVSSGSKRKKICEEEKEDKNLKRLRYLENKIANLEEINKCDICMERDRNVAFLCGHRACNYCAAPLKTCHMCRTTIIQKINLY
ncbi:E3 ubiquitin-protein ligase MIB2 [Monomorium pharaonis]|uniref:E3 ubiquitin-protein ligase MIB2 n=1 Tax=Monomorium pharaonis TaxID=307658 RepID=UPI00063FA629|nr:E3 ubiquitin-protein ligase MIB2 [Monomorium pharaonis]